MLGALDLEILPQPDDTTCGPTCLHAVYRYHGLDLTLDQVIDATARFQDGGTLAVMLGTDALRRGFDATVFTYNLMVFDPSWFGHGPPDGRLSERLALRRAAKADGEARHGRAIDAYREFLRLGGTILLEDLTTGLLRRYLRQGVPILCGLSATYLYRTMREVPEGNRLREDDVWGDPQGHFVVLCGYDPDARGVLVADPLQPNPAGTPPRYAVNIDRLICSIMLGIVTYDANLLVLKPRPGGTA